MPAGLDNACFRKAPECKIYQMDSEIQKATPSRKRYVVEPSLIRAIRVVKFGLHCVDFPELSTCNEIPNTLHAHRMTIRQIDRQKPVHLPGDTEHVTRLHRVPGQRFLAKDRFSRAQ